MTMQYSDLFHDQAHQRVRAAQSLLDEIREQWTDGPVCSLTVALGAMDEAVSMLISENEMLNQLVDKYRSIQ